MIWASDQTEWMSKKVVEELLFSKDQCEAMTFDGRIMHFSSSK